MFLMLHIVLVIHLPFLPDTWSCESWEYSIGRECCPKCDPGHHVLTHCTRGTNTVCLSCNPGWFMDHPNGLTMCLKCRQCSPGNHMQVKERCHYSQNTKCTCQPGFFCSYQLEEDSCDICARHSTAPPGFRVTQVGTETQDVKFEPCPPGTFSSKEMSLSCVKWTDCSEKDMVKTRSGNATSDVVCEPLPQSHLPLILGLGIPVALIPLAFLLAFLLQRKKGSGRTATGEGSYDDTHSGNCPKHWRAELRIMLRGNKVHNAIEAGHNLCVCGGEKLTVIRRWDLFESIPFQIHGPS